MYTLFIMDKTANTREIAFTGRLADAVELCKALKWDTTVIAVYLVRDDLMIFTA